MATRACSPTEKSSLETGMTSIFLGLADPPWRFLWCHNPHPHLSFATKQEREGAGWVKSRDACRSWSSWSWNQNWMQWCTRVQFCLPWSFLVRTFFSLAVPFSGEWFTNTQNFVDFLICLGCNFARAMDQKIEGVTFGRLLIGYRDCTFLLMRTSLPPHMKGQANIWTELQIYALSSSLESQYSSQLGMLKMRQGSRHFLHRAWGDLTMENPLGLKSSYQVGSSIKHSGTNFWSKFAWKRCASNFLSRRLSKSIHIHYARWAQYTHWCSMKTKGRVQLHSSRRYEKQSHSQGQL